MTLVAGVDSSTQSCKVLVVDADTGEVVREGRAPHPDGTAVDPNAWWDALLAAVEDAGGLDDVAAISVGAQQHGMVCLDERGEVVRDALLWNDTRSHTAVNSLHEDLPPEEWVRRTGLALLPSYTVTKVRWLRDDEPDNAARTAAVALPHDHLTWRLRGFGPNDPDLEALTTDRSDASGTGYWSGTTEDYDLELFELALGRRAVLPRVLGPTDSAGTTAEGLPGIPAGLPIGVGAGDNAAAALALQLEVGDAVMSLGTSGTVYARTDRPVQDEQRVHASFADCTGDHLPLAATLNAARNLDVVGRLLGLDHAALADLALEAAPGADGLALLPYFTGERTPNLPGARGSLHGLTLENLTPANLARATFEGMLASQVVMLEALARLGVPVHRLLLSGGAADNRALRAVLPHLVDVPVEVPSPGEYVALGAAAQAAATLTGSFPRWATDRTSLGRTELTPVVAEQHAAAKHALGYT
ncbi:FGGY family carbohydrate kinase [Georgenia sp. Z1491]|uniref:FGGY family carbohydrate kinase n=1 Tax=Georgenia sp. Z1491 TaxID=3416707 RepID=UPI003CE9652F